MAIHAIGAIRRAKLMIGGRILALAVQFTLAQDATAQLATDQLVPQMDRQYESACALSACPATVAENTGNRPCTLGAPVPSSALRANRSAIGAQTDGEFKRATWSRSVSPRNDRGGYGGRSIT
jgi:hypothetical protein